MIELRHAGVKAAYSRLSAAIHKGMEPQMILHDISLWIGSGESFALFGDRAMSKTALLRLISKQIPPDAGECNVRGRVASSIAGYDGLILRETGETNALLILREEGLTREAERLFQDGGLFGRPVGEYTQGERARLSMSIALASKPDVLVLSGQLEKLDRPFLEQFSIEIRSMTLNGMTLILDCRSMERLSRLCESALWLKSGSLFRIGSFEEVALNFHTGRHRLFENVAFSKELTPNPSKKSGKKGGKKGAIKQALRAIGRLVNGQ